MTVNLFKIIINWDTVMIVPIEVGSKKMIVRWVSFSLNFWIASLMSSSKEREIVSLVYCMRFFLWISGVSCYLQPVLHSYYIGPNEVLVCINLWLCILECRYGKQCRSYTSAWKRSGCSTKAYPSSTPSHNFSGDLSRASHWRYMDAGSCLALACCICS